MWVAIFHVYMFDKKKSKFFYFFFCLLFDIFNVFDFQFIFINKTSHT